jgi:hypothetical protein
LDGRGWRVESGKRGRETGKRGNMETWRHGDMERGERETGVDEERRIVGENDSRMGKKELRNCRIRDLRIRCWRKGGERNRRMAKGKTL